MLDPQFPVGEQQKQFGFVWDGCNGFGLHHDFWSFAREVVAAAPPNSTIVEVGCYAGRSLICMGLYAREANKGLKIVGVDNDSIGGMQSLRQNLANSRLENIEIIYTNSHSAASRFDDGSCWLVFIDAAHLHDEVERDVRAWMPKCSHWLAGHDFYMYTVHQPILALFPTQLIYDERWQDIWIVPRCPIADADIHLWQAVMPPFTEGGWKP